MTELRHYLAKTSVRVAIGITTFVVLGLAVGLIVWATLKSNNSYTCDSCDLQVRINQVGYLTDDTKQAKFMSPTDIDGELTFNLISSSDQQIILSQTITDDDLIDCFFSDNYPFIYGLDFTQINTVGKYLINITDDTNQTVATSPEFEIATSMQSLIKGFIGNSLFYFVAQRDGDQVNNQVMNRQPSHLNDRSAYVYQPPEYSSDGVLLTKSLTQIGGPVDVEGGWFDAGDYIKLGVTSSYTLLMMEITARDNYGTLNATEQQVGQFHDETHPIKNLLDEIQFGLNWFFKMWDNDTRTLYYQVGIGDGNDEIVGDHDVWRLPEDDDNIDVAANPEQYYLKHRPVFKIGPGNLSPNLGGRVAALFAVCDQLFYSRNITLANLCQSYARTVYSDTSKSFQGTLVTAIPFDYYPEDEWRDDLSMAAIELFRSFANRNQGGSSEATSRLCDAIQYMNDYLSQRSVDDRESLTVYDISALSHYEIFQVLDGTGYSCPSSDTQTAKDAVTTDISSRLQAASETSDQDCFGLGVDPSEGWDIPPFVFGLWALADMYQDMTGSNTYIEFANKQRDWLLGGNAWGFSMVVGAGSKSFHCLHHQIANLNPSLTLYGAVTDALVDVSEIDSQSGIPDGANSCAGLGATEQELESDSGYTMADDVAVYQCTEPADDYTVISLYMFARS